MSLLLRDATLPDGRRADVSISGGRIASIGTASGGEPTPEVIDAAGLWLLPGLIDLSAALQPGPDLSREMRGAAEAGVTTLLMEPRPGLALDQGSAIRDLLQHCARLPGAPNVRTIGAATIGLAGEGMADMADLMAAGCVAVGTGPGWLRDSLVARCAMRYAGDLGLPVLIRPVDPWLAGAGCAHAGRVATRLGLNAIPVVAETAALARDLVLVEDTGVHAHFGPVSSAAAVALLRAARERGLPVSADTTIQHLFLTENDLLEFDANCHVQPPFRTQADRDALRAAVAEGLLSVRSDHTPLSLDAKTAPFPATEPGISALPTLLGLALRLVDEELLDLAGVVEAFASGPARALGLPSGRLEAGAPADLVLIDPDAVWSVDPAKANWPSAGRNTPLRGWELRGRVRGRVIAGRWLANEPSGRDLLSP